MKIASLDLGSNTFLLLIAEVLNQKVEKVYRDELRVTRMAEGVHATGRLQPQALLRAEECFKEYSEMLNGERPDRIVAMATSAARDAQNGDELFKLGQKYGIPIQIIPGHQEAEVSFLGATFEYEDARGVATIDVGGGSTEVVYKNADGEISGFSLNVGSVRLTELLITEQPIPSEQIKEIKKYVEKELKKYPALPKGKVKEVVAVAGTPTTLAAVIQEQAYSSKLVHGFKLSVARLREWRDRLAEMTVADRQRLPGMDPKRADVIVTGSTILLTVAEALGVDEVTVSDKGVRYGIALLAERGAC